jgi:D-proline reductase (dithiol) PrdB
VADTEQITRKVDSFRFVDGITRRVVKTWIGLGKPADIPWTPLRKPLPECRVAFVSSGAVALRTDRPFNLEIERNNPWWSDPSYRVLPGTTKTDDVKVYHLHINTAFAEQDLNCILPLERLHELVDAGEIGSVAPSHYSYIGYTLRPQRLLDESVTAIVRQLQEEAVDIVALVPV